MTFLIEILSRMTEPPVSTRVVAKQQTYAYHVRCTRKSLRKLKSITVSVLLCQRNDSMKHFIWELHFDLMSMQALCVIANIANGSSAKEFVMRDESLLKRLMHYMMNDSVKLQMAATYCVSNLVWSTEEGAVDRQQKLRDLGVQKLLQSLLTTSDVNLFER